jgi:SOS response regulatory protein OraA/RecX
MNDTPWEGRCLDEAEAFAQRCAELRDSNPYERPALEEIMPTLMTALWDRGFSQSEIRNAFERAVAEMPQYTAGEERRGG